MLSTADTLLVLVVLLFIDYLPNCILILSFSGSRERENYPPWQDTPVAASCNLLLSLIHI